jgi:Flp pilus assembly protein TadB
MRAERPHGRRLTAAEQMRLAQLEQQLREDDPDLAAALGSTATPPTRSTTGQRGIRLAGAALAAAFLLVVGALVGGAGGLAAVAVTLLAGAGAWWLLQRRRMRR